MADYYVEKVKKIRDYIDDSCSNNISCQLLSLNTYNTPFNGLKKFLEVDSDTLRKSLSEINNKSCCLDPMLTSLVKTNIEYLLPVILKIVNLSISKCQFPNELKSGLITPTIKDMSKDTDDCSNYRPVSSLPYLSKVIEKTIHNQLSDYIEQHGFHAIYHSCETAMLLVYDDIQKDLNAGNNVILILLDSSAAFDTVDHAILLRKLEKNYFIRDGALEMLRSYLHNRSFSVKVNKTISDERNLIYGVPQGSLLGPLLYILYTKEVEKLVQSYGINIHMYADDCQLYLAFKETETAIVKEKV